MAEPTGPGLLEVRLPSGEIVPMYSTESLRNVVDPIATGVNEAIRQVPGVAELQEWATPGAGAKSEAAAAANPRAADFGRNALSLIPGVGGAIGLGQAGARYAGAQQPPVAESAQTTSVPDAPPGAGASGTSMTDLQRAMLMRRGGRGAPAPTFGMQETGRTIQGGEAITGEDIDAVEGAYGAQADRLQQNRADLEEAQANARIEQDLQTQRLEDQLDNRRSQRVEIDNRIRDLDAKRDEANARAEAAAVDPTRFYTDKPTWAKALAGIGMALTAAAQRYAEGLTGQSAQPLRGVEIMRQAWQDDIQAQKIKFEQAQDQAQLADNRYKEMLGLYGTPEAAEQAMLEQHAALAERWLETKKQAVTDQQQLQAIDQVIGEINKERQLVGTDLRARAADRITREVRLSPQVKTVPDRAPGATPEATAAADAADAAAAERAARKPQGGGRGGPAAPKQSVAEQKSNLERLAEIHGGLPGDEGKRRVNLPGGRVGWTTSSETAKELESNRSQTDQVVNILGQIDQAAANNDRQSAMSLARTAIGIITNATGAGAPTGEEAKQYLNEILGDPGSIFSLKDRGAARRNALKRQMRTKYWNDVNANTYSDPWGFERVR